VRIARSAQRMRSVHARAWTVRSTRTRKGGDARGTRALEGREAY
jgi:hypothetical protein